VQPCLVRNQIGFLGTQHLSNRLLGGFTECRTDLEIGYVGDVSAVIVTVEHVDVVVVHRSSSADPPFSLNIFSSVAR
jgi:hypothetical protein